MIQKLPQKNKGFTLVETLVAIFILSMAITSAMTVAQSSLQASYYSRDRISAYFLAEEAIEMIKNKRDENAIQNYPNGGVYWLDGIASWATNPGPCSTTTNCGVDSGEDLINTCVNLNGCKLYRSSQTGIFGHQSGADFVATKFTREVNMEEINNNEARVTVTVSWPGRPDFVISEHIFNWHPLSTLEP